MKKSNEKEIPIAEQSEQRCKDAKCPFHGSLSVRGRTFEGKVVSIHNKRLAIAIQRVIYIPKYERYAMKRTKIHAHLPACMARKIAVGDTVKIRECRPLSKIIHAVVVERIK